MSKLLLALQKIHFPNILSIIQVGITMLLKLDAFEEICCS